MAAGWGTQGLGGCLRGGGGLNLFFSGPKFPPCTIAPKNSAGRTCIFLEGISTKPDRKVYFSRS